MKGWTLEDINRIQQKTSPGKKVIHSNGITNPASFALGRMKAGTMNKTEAAYAKHLEALKYAGEVLWYEFEPINLKLSDKCFYRVDFLVMIKSGQLECHEVKGFFTDDALVKIKVAAQKFPFRFISVRLIKGTWDIREF